MTTVLYILPVETPTGIFTLSSTGGDTLDAVLFGRCEPKGKSKLLDEAAAQLMAYFTGRLKRFAVPLKITGTEFERKIYASLLQVPFGKTVSYGELAAAAGYPGRSRAAGNAMARNKIPIFVPCHRVIRSDGGPGGYAGGVSLKKALLAHEGVLYA